MPGRGKGALLVAACAATFAGVSAIVLRLLPPPHGAADYLVAGTAATFAALLVLFSVLSRRWLKLRDVFFRKRPRPKQ